MKPAPAPANREQEVSQHPGNENPDSSPLSGLVQLAKVLGQVAAPATAIGGLLYFFGYFHAFYYCDRFGVNSTILGISNRDYIIRSIDGLFIPLGVIAAVGLGLSWGYNVLPDPIRTFRPPWLIRLLAIVGVLIALNGLTRLLFATPLNRGFLVAPISVIVGVLLVWAVAEVRIERNQDLPDGGESRCGRWTGRAWFRRRPAARHGKDRHQATLGEPHVEAVAHQVPPGRDVSEDEAASQVGGLRKVFELTVIFVLIVGSLFWIANDYSSAAGSTRAQEVEEQLPWMPTVVLFSDKDLHLEDSPGIRDVACSDPTGDSAYHHRYDGLVLILQTSENYVMVPRTWTSTAGHAIVLPRNSIGAVRLEFVRPNVAELGSRC
jgi:hypothetical protein